MTVKPGRKGVGRSRFLLFCLLLPLFFLLLPAASGFLVPDPGENPFPTVPDPGKVYLFYDRNCAECQRILAFFEESEARYPTVHLSRYDISDNPEVSAYFQRWSYLSGVEQPEVPAVFFAGQMIEGEEKIEGELPVLLSANESPDYKTVSTASASATQPAAVIDSGNFSPKDGTLYVFYNVHCSECQRVLTYLEGFTARHPKIPVSTYDIFDNATNENLFQEFNSVYGVPYSPVPAAFYNGSAFIGEDQIEEWLEPVVEGTATLPPRETPGTNTTPPGGDGIPEGHGITIPLVISAALVDGVNPCAFAVLIFLLISIISLDSKKRMVMVGGAFISAVFVFYLLSGLGLFAAVQVAGVARIFSFGAALLALAAGLLMLRDALSSSDTPLMAIPESRRATIDRYIKGASVPGAIVLGILVGLFELPCTGGIYLAILSLLSEQMTLSQGLPLLVLYNIIFILPLVVILLLVVWGIPPEKLTRWRKERRKLVRLLMSAVMIGIGLVVLFLAINR